MGGDESAQFRACVYSGDENDTGEVCRTLARRSRASPTRRKSEQHGDDRERVRLWECDLDAQCLSTHLKNSARPLPPPLPPCETDDSKIETMKLISLFALTLLMSTPIFAQTDFPSDNDAIRKTALDYIEGWYSGDAARMERALHPELAKRMISTDPKTGRSQFNHMGAMTLVQRTREGIGKKIPQDRQSKEVTILDRYNNAAVVKIVASDWIDYLEVARFNGDWKIINVLWELKPKPQSS